MVVIVLDVHKTNCDNPPGSSEGISLREETRRTGRYVAAGTAIFLSLLGVYQALIQGTPEYAALFAPAVIMFVYVLWILHASRNQNARLLKRNEQTMEIAEEEEEEEEEPSTNHSEGTVTTITTTTEKMKQFNRSYSIA